MRPASHCCFAVASRIPALLVLSIVALLVAGCSAPVEVRWSTETEMNTAGFNLYRSEFAKGPFDLKINEQLIPASPDPLTGGDYTFVDRSTRSGLTYYYELEEVELNGTTARHGPITVTAQNNDLRNTLLIIVGGGCIAFWVVWRRTRPASTRETG